MSTINTVCIIGAGTMGNGIAQACAVVGIHALMIDINEAAIERGLKAVSGSLDRLVRKENLTETQKAEAMARITEALTTGGSIVVSDQGINQGETGEGTDFIVSLH